MSPRTRSADASTDEDQRETDRGVAPTVTREIPKLTVECLDDVDLYVDGKKVEPGEKAKVDGPSAVNLVMLGHAKIVPDED